MNLNTARCPCGAISQLPHARSRAYAARCEACIARERASVCEARGDEQKAPTWLQHVPTTYPATSNNLRVWSYGQDLAIPPYVAGYEAKCDGGGGYGPFGSADDVVLKDVDPSTMKGWIYDADYGGPWTIPQTNDFHDESAKPSIKDLPFAVESRKIMEDLARKTAPYDMHFAERFLESSGQCSCRECCEKFVGQADPIETAKPSGMEVEAMYLYEADRTFGFDRSHLRCSWNGTKVSVTVSGMDQAITLVRYEVLFANGLRVGLDMDPIRVEAGMPITGCVQLEVA
jgi:hypothetical protein